MTNTDTSQDLEEPVKIEEVLRHFGVASSTLSAEQLDCLDRDGFVALPGLLEPSRVEQVRVRLDQLAAEEGDQAGIEVHQEEGTARLANLIDKDSLFDLVWNNPWQLAAVMHVLGGHPFKLSSLNARAALPGHGHQALHADWGKAVEPGEYQVCNSIWMLDDFTAENGATRVVPGSHRFGKTVGDVMPDRLAAHPDQVLVTGKAGTCVVFNSHLWHGGTVNTTDRPRRAAHGYFVRRQHPQQLVQRDHLSPATLARLTPAQRYLLDV